MQVNHPDMGWMFFDRNGDGIPDHGLLRYGRPDGRHRGPSPECDSLRVRDAGVRPRARLPYNNTIHNWLQLLNRGSGSRAWSTPTPTTTSTVPVGFGTTSRARPTTPPTSRLSTSCMPPSKAALVMTNGPFMDVRSVRAGRNGFRRWKWRPGEDLQLLVVRRRCTCGCRCPNWFDVDRVQVFVNGRADRSLNFTRAKNSADRSGDAVEVRPAIPLSSSKATPT